MLQFQDFINNLLAAATPYIAEFQKQEGGPFGASVLTYAKIVSGIISALLFAGIVVLMMKFYKTMGTSPIDRLSESIRASAIPKERIGKQWERIKARIVRGSEAEWKLAVIEADKLCDNILRRMGYHGESMDQRLKAIKPAQLSSLENLKVAHQVYLTVVQDPSFSPSQYEAQEALRNYETFLQEMQAIS